MHCMSSCISAVLQEALDDPKVAPYICGYFVNDGPLFPGETSRGIMKVDTEVCGDRPVFSMVSMLSESLSRRGSVMR